MVYQIVVECINCLDTLFSVCTKTEYKKKQLVKMKEEQYASWNGAADS